MRNVLVSWVVIFVLSMAGSFLVHGVLLQTDSAQLADFHRGSARP